MVEFTDTLITQSTVFTFSTPAKTKQKTFVSDSWGPLIILPYAAHTCRLESLLWLPISVNHV
jgi:hypothetical protein